MPNDAAAKKPGSAEHGDGALVRDRHGSTSLSQSRPRSVINDNASARLPGALRPRSELIVRLDVRWRDAAAADGIEILFAAGHESAGHESRFWPKADIDYCTAHVCFWG